MKAPLSRRLRICLVYSPKRGVLNMSRRSRTRKINLDGFNEAPRARRHHVDDIGQDHRFGNRMGDEECGRVALEADALKLHVHEVAADLVECAEGFVEQQHIRLGNQHPAHGGTLRHAAESSPG